MHHSASCKRATSATWVDRSPHKSDLAVLVLQGQGLIELAGAPEGDEPSLESGSEAMVRLDSSASAYTSYDPDHAELPGAKNRRAVSQIKLICIDMDGEPSQQPSLILFGSYFHEGAKSPSAGAAGVPQRQRLSLLVGFLSLCSAACCRFSKQVMPELCSFCCRDIAGQQQQGSAVISLSAEGCAGPGRHGVPGNWQSAASCLVCPAVRRPCRHGRHLYRGLMPEWSSKSD